LKRTLAQVGQLVLLALLLAAAPLGCSWLLGVAGDPVTDGPATDGGDEGVGDAGDAGDAGQSAQDAAAE
jgi:hypothetical protein